MEVIGRSSGSVITPVSLLGTPSPRSQLQGISFVWHIFSSGTIVKKGEQSETNVLLNDLTFDDL